MSLGRLAKTALNTWRRYPKMPTPRAALAAGDTIPIARTITEPDRPAVSSAEACPTPAANTRGNTRPRQASDNP